MSDGAPCLLSHMWLFSCCLHLTVKCMTSVLKSVSVSPTSIKCILDTAGKEASLLTPTYDGCCIYSSAQCQLSVSLLRFPHRDFPTAWRQCRQSHRLSVLLSKALLAQMQTLFDFPGVSLLVLLFSFFSFFFSHTSTNPSFYSSYIAQRVLIPWDYE